MGLTGSQRAIMPALAGSVARFGATRFGYVYPRVSISVDGIHRGYGKTDPSFKVEDLSQSFENISNELRSQYNLLYRPEPLHTDGLFHTIDIKVKGRKELIVRARKGYYAPRL